MVTTTSLPSGAAGSAYSGTLLATGGDGSYTWTLASGSAPLPAGLGLATNGDITGTPSASAVGTVSITAQVASGGQTAQQALLISVQLPTQGLMAFYPFNGDASDKSGNGNDGTVVGATLTADRFGNANSAYAFNGVNEVVEVGDSPNVRFGSGDFSISVWFYFDGTLQLASFLRKGQPTSPFQQYSIMIRGGDPFTEVPGKMLLVFLRPDNNGGDRWIALSSNLEVGWHHVVLVNNYNAHLQGYLDGQNVGQDARSFGGGRFDSLGRPLGMGHFSGRLDDIRIYNRVLNATEIQALFEEGG